MLLLLLLLLESVGGLRIQLCYFFAPARKGRKGGREALWSVVVESCLKQGTRREGGGGEREREAGLPGGLTCEIIYPTFRIISPQIRLSRRYEPEVVRC